LALGLSRLLGDRLTIIVNTGDDFEHLGLHVSPDIDTTVYTLCGLANKELGWGRDGETWNFMEAAGALGAPEWFRLGDKDLAMNIIRTARLRQGESLSDITADVSRHLSVSSKVIPMTDAPVRTMIDTPDGPLEFQEYFVRQRCAPKALGIRFVGAEHAMPVPAALEALAAPDLAGVIICPSNPYLSVDPILAVPSMTEAISAAGPVIAVSPIIGGNAVKGPAAKLMRELGREVSAQTVAEHYGELLDGFVLDTKDAALASEIATQALVAETLMVEMEDKVRLATDVLAFAKELSRERLESRPEAAR